MKLPYPENDGQTHYPGCWMERGHHNCAIEMVHRLAKLVEEAYDKAGGYWKDAEDVLRWMK